MIEGRARIAVSLVSVGGWPSRSPSESKKSRIQNSQNPKPLGDINPKEVADSLESRLGKYRIGELEKVKHETSSPPEEPDKGGEKPCRT